MSRQLTTWTPRLPRTFRRLQDEMEGLMERFFGRNGDWFPEFGWTETEWTPRANVAETDKGFEVEFEVPGLKPEEITVEMRDGDLVISGEHKEEKEEKGKTFHRMERHYGRIFRRIPLPREVEKQKVEAQYHEGVLKVLLPKTKAAETKKIPVKT
jgi:HSP20 family protein